MDKGDRKTPGPYKLAVEAARERAGDARETGEGYVLHVYPDHDTYREVQIAGNKAKLRMQFVKESHIRIVSEQISRLQDTVRFGICHGTRRGAEQAWFRRHLPGAPEVIGTEISDTAADFPDTIQWDFHDVNPDWSGQADFVYSNSWDHARHPEAAFEAWFDALRPGGCLYLDHTKGQSPEAANALDPFGVTYERLTDILATLFEGRAELLDPIDTRKTNKEYRARVVVLRRNADPDG